MRLGKNEIQLSADAEPDVDLTRTVVCIAGHGADPTVGRFGALARARRAGKIVRNVNGLD